MTSTPTNLSQMARSKLSRAPATDSKDSFSLHRWVLLKNSIIQTTSPHTSVVSVPAPAPPTVATVATDDEGAYEDTDGFMFPDAGKLMERPAASEAAWLDSLLETLDDADEEDLPPISPMSSSDDLTTSMFYPFLSPYPAFSPQPTDDGASLYSLPPSPPSTISLFSSSYADPLPYGDLDDDLEDLPPVPEAIDDLSDDDSDGALTPGQSLSTLSPLDPASIPLPPEHSHLRHPPHIFLDADEDEDYFHFDALPFPRNSPVPIYSECS